VLGTTAGGEQEIPCGLENKLISWKSGRPLVGVPWRSLEGGMATAAEVPDSDSDRQAPPTPGTSDFSLQYVSVPPMHHI